jgi:hypothetical protein
MLKLVVQTYDPWIQSFYRQATVRLSAEQCNLMPTQVFEKEVTLHGLILRDFISIPANSAKCKVQRLMFVIQMQS